MKKNNFFGIVFFMSFSAVLVSLLLCFIFYNQFVTHTYSSIKTTAALFADILNADFASNFFASKEFSFSLVDPKELRITIIGEDGSVLYDNAKDTAALPNHKERKEIKDALINGFGESSRVSNTLGLKTYYYAVRLSNGAFLRLSKTQKSVFHIFIRTLPFIISFIVFIIIISYFIAKNLTRKIGNVAVQLNDLKNAEKLRREFSANVSHELKTPLTSISGYAELLQGGMVRESDKNAFIQKIKDETVRLITLVEDIMMISQLDEKNSSKEKETFEQVDLVETALLTSETLALKAREHEVSVFIDRSTGHCFITANKTMMTQLFYNLIDNAIKYNKQGGSVTVSFSENTGIKKRASVSVSDTGIGIPKEAQRRVFERFYRVDKSRSKKTGGTGLGLAIVKHIALLHNAEISLESREEVGTTIKIVF